MSFEMIVFDLDGTLLTADFQLTDETLAAVERIRALGLRIGVATGRSYLSAQPFLDQLQITEPMVFSNGCVVDNPETGERELLAGVPLETALIALMLCDQFGLSAKAHLADGSILKSNDTPWPGEGVHFVTGEVRPQLKAELEEDPIKMVFCGDSEKLLAFKERVEQILGAKAQARLFQSHAYYVEMVNKNVSKGDTLKILAQKLGLQNEQLITVGDQENDYEMLKYFGLGIRVGTAHPNLAEVSQHQIALPEEKGIEELYELLIKEYGFTAPT